MREIVSPRALNPSPATIPTTFPKFKNLPPELRVKIWEMSLPPGRHVVLDAYVFQNVQVHGDMAFKQHNKTLIEQTPDLPVTLYVNGESRAETLRKYTIVFFDDIFRTCSLWDRDRFKTKPFCIDPSVDKFYFSHRSVVNHIIAFKRWLSFLKKKIPDGLKKIATLEVVNVVWEAIIGEN